MPGRRPSRGVKWLERTLFVFGAVCLGYYGYMTAEARHFQREQSAAFEALVARAAPAGERTPSGTSESEDEQDVLSSDVEQSAGATAPALAPETAGGPSRIAPTGSLADPEVIALLDIPRLKLSTPVVSGDDDATLDVAVGHLPDTPRPWEPGNSALAGHRDGLFRPLRHIRVGDAVRVRTLEGEIIYRVRETKIVMPHDLSVLAPTDEQTLTLITCYPFNFVGNAPKRFIVHAERVPVAR